MHTTGAEALLVRLELIQGPCNGTGENEPSFKIVRTVTSGYTPRCYNWGLFREGRFSQPPSCELSPVVISHARRREGRVSRLPHWIAKIACVRYGLPHRVRSSLRARSAGLDGPFPTATFWFANPIASASSQDDPSQHFGNWIAQDSLARTS